jgi:hypothetical protein
VQAVVLDLNPAREAQPVGRLIDGDQRARVREHAVDPADAARGTQRELCLDHPQVMAVARVEDGAVLV